MPEDRSASLLKRLLEISKRADAAERELEEDRRAYERTRDRAVLERLRAASQRAFDAEVEFETVWKEAAKLWANAPFAPPRVPSNAAPGSEAKQRRDDRRDDA